MEDTSIQNLFHTPSFISPFDEVHSTIDGLHAIGRPIEENLLTPSNRILSTSSSHIFRQINNLNFGRDQLQNNEGLEILDSVPGEINLPLEPTASLLTLIHLGERGNREREVIVNP